MIEMCGRCSRKRTGDITASLLYDLLGELRGCRGHGTRTRHFARTVRWGNAVESNTTATLEFAERLDRVRERPLDRIDAGDVAEIVDRVVSTEPDPVTLHVAAFGSSI